MVLSKIIPLGFLSVGIFLLVQIILPVISFQIWLIGQKYSNNLMISPSSPKRGQILGVSVQNQQTFPAFVSATSRETPVNFNEFSLTIPKLKINQAPVLVDSNDLSKGLVHLPGSALPGEKGNIFISGHSALNKLFSLKSVPFANLTNLKKGDQILVEALGVKFKYEVFEIKVVDPSDLSVIAPSDPQGRYISLMTCVPPGLNYKRLVVLGKMI
ncbi:class E sortase [Candidatus Daviesbacteria bacterium]|nr:class E sortase [Candidatus Daviesbacteria bacterium]